MAEIAFALGVGDGDASDQVNARAAVDFVAALFGAIGIPASLCDLGLAAKDMGWTVTQALGATRLVKNNPRLLNEASMSTLVQAAFDGAREPLYALSL